MAGDIPSMIAAVGALGTASYGLVDASKALWGGVSNAGFIFIRRVITSLLPENGDSDGKSTLLDRNAALNELKASWMNGTPLTDQRTIAKSLIKLRMSDDNARSLAEMAGVNPDLLASVVTKMSSGGTLTAAEADVSGRFDLILTTALDQAYQRADQRYRNWCKLAAIPVSLILAVFGGWTIQKASGSSAGYFSSALFLKAVIAGLLATPLAPVVKDLSSAVQAGTKVVQSIKN